MNSGLGSSRKGPMMRKAMTVTTITGNTRFTWRNKATGNSEKGDDNHHDHRQHQVNVAQQGNRQQ